MQTERISKNENHENYESVGIIITTEGSRSVTWKAKEEIQIIKKIGGEPIVVFDD